jgi:prevent-host-death family protein
MLDIANDIRSLSDFKRNTSELLDRLKKTGNPLVLTINGKAELVVQDAEAYRNFWNAWRPSRLGD